VTEIQGVFRAEYVRAAAMLIRRFEDVDPAEAAVQDAPKASALLKALTDRVPEAFRPTFDVVCQLICRVTSRIRRPCRHQLRADVGEAGPLPPSGG